MYDVDAVLAVDLMTILFLGSGVVFMALAATVHVGHARRLKSHAREVARQLHVAPQAADRGL